MKKVLVALALAAAMVVGLVVASSFDSGGVADRAADDAGEICTPENVGEERGPVVVIYSIENGNLGEVCFGEADEVTEDAWDELTRFVPPEERTVLSLFAGFDTVDGTAGFAGGIDAAHTRFVIAVDRGFSENDPEELKLTMAHEFAHVLTRVNAQFDPDGDPDTCDTLWNGDGCFLDGSLIADYVDSFWSDADLDSLPADGGIDLDGGEERCLVDPAFLGAYAASHPEEDFAEVFSAYVFGLDVPEGVQPKIGFMDERVGLRGYRDRALASSDETPPGNFDPCG